MPGRSTRSLAVTTETTLLTSLERRKSCVTENSPVKTPLGSLKQLPRASLTCLISSKSPLGHLDLTNTREESNFGNCEQNQRKTKTIRKNKRPKVRTTRAKETMMIFRMTRKSPRNAWLGTKKLSEKSLTRSTTRFWLALASTSRFSCGTLIGKKKL